MNAESLFIEKLRQTAPARVHIKRVFEQGVRASVPTTVVDIAEDGSASALAFTSDLPDQQMLSFHSGDQAVTYLGGALTKRGTVESAKPGSGPLQAFVNKSRGYWDHPAADAFQFHAVAWLSSATVPIGADGRFSFTNSQDRATVTGLFDSDRRLFKEVQVVESNGDSTRYEYGGFTNFHGCHLPQTMRLIVSRGRQRGESHCQFSFEDSADLLAPAMSLKPPLGTLVTDERFKPALTYYVEKPVYSGEDLTAMHAEQVRTHGAFVETPGKGSRPRWFQYGALFLAAGLPLLLGRFFLKWRRSQLES